MEGLPKFTNKENKKMKQNEENSSTGEFFQKNEKPEHHDSPIQQTAEKNTLSRDSYFDENGCYIININTADDSNSSTDDEYGMLVVEIGDTRNSECSDAHAQSTDVFDERNYTSLNTYDEVAEFENFHFNDARFIREYEEAKEEDSFWSEHCRANSTQTDDLSEDLFDCLKSEYEDFENHLFLEDSIRSDWPSDELVNHKKKNKKRKKKGKKKQQKKLKKIKKLQKNAELFTQNQWHRPFEPMNGIFRAKCEELEIDLSEEQRLLPYELCMRVVDNFNVIVVDGVCYIHDGTIYRNYTDDALKSFLKTLLTVEEQRLLNKKTYEDAIDQIIHEPSIICENPPYPKGIVAFENGMFDLSTGEKFDHPENYFLTYKIRSKYNPEKKIKTPVFNKFLDDISGGDPQIKDRIMYMIAYSILPGNMGKCFFVCGTAPDSGKSVLGKLIESFFDKKNVSNVTLHDFSKQFELAPLQNSVLNCYMDEDASIIPKASISKLKVLTGNDGSQLSIKYKTSIPYYNQAKFIFGTNHRFLLDTDDPAFWNRLIFVPFMYSTAKKDQDPDLLDMLKAEKEGIIQKAIKYARILIEKKYKFPPCDIAEAVVDSWRFGRNSSVYTFIRNCCEITDDEKNGTHSAELFEAYELFCNEIGVEGVNQNMFSRTLTDVFNLPHEKWNGKWGYKGIFLK